MRTALAPVFVAAIALALVGCTPQPEAPTDSSSSPTPITSASPSSEPSAEPSSEPLLPVPSCEELVSAETMYEYNSNVALTPDYTPPASSLAARVAATGVACGWINLSSNEVIAVAVGAPDSAGLSAFTTELGGLGTAQWNGVSGYFGASGGTPTGAAVTDGYVVVTSSPVYIEAADAAPIIDAVLAAL